jgi:DnaD/phage-associated family protein
MAIKPWLKMWIEWIHDFKMDGLSLSQQGAWWRLIALAGELEAHNDGRLDSRGGGVPLSINAICKNLKIANKVDRKTFDAMLSYMIEEGSLRWDGKCLVISQFAKRQSQAPSETKEAVRRRVADYRRRHQDEKGSSSPLTTPSLTDDRGQRTEPPPIVPPQGKVVTNPLQNSLHVTSKTLHLEPVVAEISNLYESNLGLLSPLIWEKIRDFSEHYHGPIKWIKDAFAEALSHGARNWAYVEKVLYTWQDEGRQTHGEKRGKSAAAAYQRGSIKNGRYPSGEPTPERYRESLKGRKGKR